MSALTTTGYRCRLKKMRQCAESDTNLITASKKGDLDGVLQALAGGARPDATDMFGKTALLLAANHGHIEIVRHLISEGADVNAADQYGNTPLVVALSLEPDIHYVLLEAGAQVNVRGANNNTPIAAAALMGRADLVKRYLELGAEVEPADSIGSSALMNACANGHLDLARTLIEKHGADVNYRDADLGWTTLLLAVRRGDVLLVQYLVQQGADLHCRDARGITAIHQSAAYQHLEVLHQLIAAGADINLSCELGRTPLMMSASTCHHWKRDEQCLPCTRALIDSGADLAKADRWGFTALHLCAYDGHSKTAQMLLDAGAALNLKNQNGDRPLEIAVTRRVMDRIDERREKVPATAGGDPYYDVMKLLFQAELKVYGAIHYRRLNKLIRLAKKHRCPEAAEYIKTTTGKP